jgi:hypothetical protein
MKYFKVLLMWLGYIATTSIYGEYVVSREVNGFLQLLWFVGLVGVLIYLTNETANILFKNKKQKND